MDIAFDALAMAALGGASGQLGQNAVTVLWERLKARFTHDTSVATALDARDGSDSTTVLRISGALRELAESDPEFRAELEGFTHQYYSSAPIINKVHDSQGLNAPGGSFTAPITMNFGDSTESSTR